MRASRTCCAANTAAPSAPTRPSASTAVAIAVTSVQSTAQTSTPGQLTGRAAPGRSATGPPRATIPLQAPRERVQQPAVACGLPAPPFAAVAHVCEHDLRIGVVEPERAARSEVPVGAWPRAERAVRLGELEAEAEARAAAEHEVLAVRPRARRLVEHVLAEQRGDAVEHLGHAAGAPVRVRARYLRRAPLRRVDGAEAVDPGRVEVRAREQQPLLLSELGSSVGALTVAEVPHELGHLRTFRRPERDARLRAREPREALAERLAARPAHDLTAQEPERVDVIAVRGPGLPPRLLGLQRVHQPLPFVGRLGRQLLADRGMPGLMGEHLAQRRVLPR